MSAAQLSGPDLLKAVKQLGPHEFDAFIDQALSSRAWPQTNTLSAEETKLIKLINRGLPSELCRRYAQLQRNQKKGALTRDERAELLDLTHQFESRDAERAAALVSLAKLRSVPVRTLMKHLGIKAAPVHG